VVAAMRKSEKSQRQQQLQKESGVSAPYRSTDTPAAAPASEPVSGAFTQLQIVVYAGCI